MAGSVPTQEEQERSFQEARKLSASANARKKQEALQACASEHVDLVECFKNQSFAACREAHHAFWECFTRERGFHRITFRHIFGSQRGDAQRGKPDGPSAS